MRDQSVDCFRWIGRVYAVVLTIMGLFDGKNFFVRKHDTAMAFVFEPLKTVVIKRDERRIKLTVVALLDTW
jgi:hypothetical protein